MSHIDPRREHRRAKMLDHANQSVRGHHSSGRATRRHRQAMSQIRRAVLKQPLQHLHDIRCSGMDDCTCDACEFDDDVRNKVRQVRLIVTVEPSPLDDDWGTPNDFAQFVTAVALGDSGFVTHAAEGGESEEAHWWITPERAEIGPTMATLALEITAGRSRVWSPSDLEHELGRCGVVRNHQSPVIDAMKAGRRLLWIPSTQRYVVFAHDPSRSSRGSAPDRATDAMRLLADRDPDALEAELIAEFVAQHGLKPDSAAAAVRSARSEVR